MKSSVRHTTCATIAQETLKGMVADLRTALRRSEYAELRLDFLEPASVPDALHACRRHINRCVCTVRSASEGGRFCGTEAERRDLLRLAAECRPYLVDVEYDTIRRSRKLALDLEGAEKLISWHYFEGTPPLGVLSRKVELMARYSPYVKLVTTAKRAGDAARLAALYGMAGGTKLIAFCMGDLGRISRLISLYLGAPYTYVSLGRSIAPGQYSLDEIRSLERLQGRTAMRRR